MAGFYESKTLLKSKLPVKDGSPYYTVAKVTIPEIQQGQIAIVYAESQGDPRQNRDRKECNWVTGVRVNGTEVCEESGRDLYYAMKGRDCRVGVYAMPGTNILVEYVQRAQNTVSGGSFNLSWAKVGAAII